MGCERVSQHDYNVTSLLTEKTVRAQANDKRLMTAMVEEIFHHTLHFIL